MDGLSRMIHNAQHAWRVTSDTPARPEGVGPVEEVPAPDARTNAGQSRCCQVARRPSTGIRPSKCSTAQRQLETSRLDRSALTQQFSGPSAIFRDVLIFREVLF
jgi:hypothetical protein